LEAALEANRFASAGRGEGCRSVRAFCNTSSRREFDEQKSRAFVAERLQVAGEGDCFAVQFLDVSRNRGGNLPSNAVDVKTSHGTGFRPVSLIGGSAASTKPETSGLRDRKARPPACPG